MLQTMFPFDIFGFFSGFFILIFVIVIVIFVIVIIIIYKLLHTNVDNVRPKKVDKAGSSPRVNKYRSTNETVKDKLATEKKINTCKYCSERIEDNATFCPFCGSNLIN